jgi:hypothetical protein
MEYDQDKVDEMVLSLLFLTVFDQDQYGRERGNGTTGTRGTCGTRRATSLIQEQGQIGRGDRGRCAAIPRAIRETLREERTQRASAVGFAATVTASHSEAGRGYGRGSRPVKPRSAKSTERLGGCAALRGVDSPRPRP